MWDIGYWGMRYGMCGVGHWMWDVSYWDVEHRI